jgi:hypothetical protein
MFLLLGAVRNCPQSPQGEAVEKREVRGPRHSRNVLLPGKRGGGGSENVYIESLSGYFTKTPSPGKKNSWIKLRFYKMWYDKAYSSTDTNRHTRATPSYNINCDRFIKSTNQTWEKIRLHQHKQRQSISLFLKARIPFPEIQADMLSYLLTVQVCPQPLGVALHSEWAFCSSSTIVARKK